MIATVHLPLVVAGRRQFHRRRSAELAAPQYERILEHASLFQVLQQRADRLVAFLCQLAMIDLDVVVIVPGLPCPVPDLDEAHTLLQQAARYQDLPGLNRASDA